MLVMNPRLAASSPEKLVLGKPWLLLPTSPFIGDDGTSSRRMAFRALSCLCSAWSTYHVQIQTWMNSSLPLAIRPFKNPPNIREEDYTDVEIGVSGGRRAERGVESSQTLICYNEPLEEYHRRATRIKAELEARKCF